VDAELPNRTCECLVGPGGAHLPVILDVPLRCIFARYWVRMELEWNKPFCVDQLSQRSGELLVIVGKRLPWRYRDVLDRNDLLYHQSSRHACLDRTASKQPASLGFDGSDLEYSGRDLSSARHDNGSGDAETCLSIDNGRLQESTRDPVGEGTSCGPGNPRKGHAYTSAVTSTSSPSMSVILTATVVLPLGAGSSYLPWTKSSFFSGTSDRAMLKTLPS